MTAGTSAHDEIPYDHLWLSRVSDAVSHALEAGLDSELILDAVAIGLELEQRTALWGGSPLSLSLARAFNSSTARASRASTSYPESGGRDASPRAVEDLTGRAEP